MNDYNALNAFMNQFDLEPYRVDRARFAPVIIDVDDSKEDDVSKQPKPTNVTRNVCARVDEAQFDAMQTAKEKSGINNMSDVLRTAIADFCQKHGVEWPEGDYAWGGDRTPKD